jgi:hypothetical protein
MAPLTINIDGKIYTVTVDIQPDEFYGMMEALPEFLTIQNILIDNEFNSMYIFTRRNQSVSF